MNKNTSIGYLDFETQETLSKQCKSFLNTALSDYNCIDFVLSLPFEPANKITFINMKYTVIINYEVMNSFLKGGNMCFFYVSNISTFKCVL